MFNTILLVSPKNCVIYTHTHTPIIYRLRALAGVLFLLLCARASAQVSLRTNFLDDITLAPQLGADIILSSHYSLSLDGCYAGVRWWPSFTHTGWYVGAQGYGGQFNAAGLPLLGLKDRRKQGYLLGAGLNGGYLRQISVHFGIEAGIGIGATVAHFDEYRRGNTAGASAASLSARRRAHSSAPPTSTSRWSTSCLRLRGRHLSRQKHKTHT